MLGQTIAKAEKRKVRWTSSLTDLPQKMHKKLQKSHATVKNATTWTASQMTLS